MVRFPMHKSPSQTPHPRSRRTCCPSSTPSAPTRSWRSSPGPTAALSSSMTAWRRSRRGGRAAAQRRGGALPRGLAALYNRRVHGPEHALLREHSLVFHPPDACSTKEFIALAALQGEFLDVLSGIPSSDGPKLFVVRPLNPVLLRDAGSAARVPGRPRHTIMPYAVLQGFCSLPWEGL
ncbi:hypothetical protein GQ55_5G412800 [Panicum hallii var. hallii]|uniref:Uncharacterized protein n=1 Tax=Panicum hallii var. hallii TaxID=1504633 RepID=A0A2T7DNR6_9POAL|nr:hypothetical protein GQ55_5G412800 [Panicum hallii var. hallii]